MRLLIADPEPPKQSERVAARPRYVSLG